MAYSLYDPLVLDAESRRAQASKILAVIRPFADASGIGFESRVRCLDIGCSSGIITRSLASQFPQTVGIDVDLGALSHSQQAVDPCARFAAASSLALPFPAQSFDVAVCNQVYQYVAEVPRLFAEIRRVLRSDGLCFFSARNLWGIAAKENHLPFAASCSAQFARTLERMTKPEPGWRQRAGVLWPYCTLRALAENYFTVHDYTTRVVHEPCLAELFVPSRACRWLVRLPLGSLDALKPILPTHLWILQKPRSCS